MRPNVLMIMVDQMRADCLSILNHPVVDTPNLDQLAREGVLFHNAYTACPSCVPARASILTGMSQRSTGKLRNDRTPWNFENTMPDEFAKAGYHTQCVGKMNVYPTRKLCGYHNVLLHDGYMHYNRFKHKTKAIESFEQTDDYLPWVRERAGSQVDLIDLGLDCNSSTVARPWALAEALHPTNWVTTQSIDFVRRRDPTKPFFLKMSYVRPHPPFDPPRFYYDMYHDLDLPDPSVGGWVEKEDNEKAGLNPVTSKGKVPEKRMKQAQAAYYALITHIDHQIGRFFMAMREYGVYDNTVILFVSDHGELLGDHNLFRKVLPYEGSAKVPLIIADPGNNLNSPKNMLVEEAVELKDIMPTLLDVADIKIPSSVEGESMMPLWKQTPEKTDWRTYIHGEHLYGEQSFHYITDGKEKFIWFSQTGEEQFFDLVLDPHELENLIEANSYCQRINIRRDQLVKELIGREEGYTDGKELLVVKSIGSALDH